MRFGIDLAEPLRQFFIVRPTLRSRRGWLILCCHAFSPNGLRDGEWQRQRFGLAAAAQPIGKRSLIHQRGPIKRRGGRWWRQGLSRWRRLRRLEIGSGKLWLAHRWRGGRRFGRLGLLNCAAARVIRAQPRWQSSFINQRAWREHLRRSGRQIGGAAFRAREAARPIHLPRGHGRQISPPTRCPSEWVHRSGHLIERRTGSARLWIGRERAARATGGSRWARCSRRTRYRKRMEWVI